MTSGEFKEARLALGLGQTELGAVLDRNPKTISQMENNATPVPAVVAIAMRAMVRLGLPETWMEKTLPVEV